MKETEFVYTQGYFRILPIENLLSILYQRLEQLKIEEDMQLGTLKYDFEQRKGTQHDSARNYRNR